MTMDRDREWASRILGDAVIDLWSEMPPEVQHTLFEQAVLAGQWENGEKLRERLAKFLHDHHQRTASHRRAAAMK